ncbi:uncharacterized protein LOC135922875 [Gordionus sp. m RMFG-2023]|uniref:uncharacterized protein LOC135922875 n=1 Tax=Gordionus sp. m RMFG-2023 TaxID=3053472 RepID=UPI0031FBDF9E
MGMINELTNALPFKNTNKNGFLSNEILIKNIKIFQSTETFTIDITLSPSIESSQINVKILSQVCSVKIAESTWKYTYPHAVNLSSSSYAFDPLKQSLIIHLTKEHPSKLWPIPNEFLHSSSSSTGTGSHSHLQISNTDSGPRGDQGNSPTASPLKDGSSSGLDTGTLDNKMELSDRTFLTMIPSSPLKSAQHDNDNFRAHPNSRTFDIPRLKVQWYEREKCVGLTVIVKNCVSADWVLTNNTHGSLPILTIVLENFKSRNDLLLFLSSHRMQNALDDDENYNKQLDDAIRAKRDGSGDCDENLASSTLGSTSRVDTRERSKFSFSVQLKGVVVAETVKMSFYKENIKIDLNKAPPMPLTSSNHNSSSSSNRCGNSGINHHSWDLNTIPHDLLNHIYKDLFVDGLDDHPLRHQQKFKSASECLGKTKSKDVFAFPTYKTYDKESRMLSNSPKVSDVIVLPDGTDTYSSYDGRKSGMSGRNRLDLAGYCGLINLGNTCFMNCVIQILANTPALRDYFLTGSFKGELNTENPLGLNGELASAFAELMKDLWGGTNTAVSPFKLKSLISLKANQFLGYSQHDAQEFLAFLLDGLHEDLNRIKNKPYTAQIETRGRSDMEIATETWDYYLKRNDSFVSHLFLGQYKSLLICPECKTKSTTFDPLLYMTLPLPEKSHPVTIHYFDLDCSNMADSDSPVPLKYVFRMAYGSKFQAVAERIEAHSKKPAKNISFLEVEKSKFCRKLNHNDEIASVLMNREILAFQNLPNHFHTDSNTSWHGEFKQILVIQNLLEQPDLSLSLTPNYSPIEDVITSPASERSKSDSDDEINQMQSWGTPCSEKTDKNARTFSREGAPFTGPTKGYYFGGNSNNLKQGHTASLSHQNAVTFEDVQRDFDAREGVYNSNIHQKTGNNESCHGDNASNHMIEQDGGDSQWRRRMIGKPFLLNVPAVGLTLSRLKKMVSKMACLSVGFEPYPPSLVLNLSQTSSSSYRNYNANTTSSNARPGLMGGVSLIERMETNFFEKATIYNDDIDATKDSQGFPGEERPEFDRRELPIRDATETTNVIDARAPTPDSEFFIDSSNDPPFRLRIKGSDYNSRSPEKDAIIDEGTVDLTKVHCISVEWMTHYYPNAESDERASRKSQFGSYLTPSNPAQNYKIFDKELEQNCHFCEQDGCSPSTRGSRECSVPSNDENTLHNCLRLFSKKEVLTPEEAWYCPNCKTHRQAEKTMSLWKFPRILVIIFKRFSYGNHYWREKLDKLITFPIENLDLRDVYEGPSTKKPLYDLYGVINHHGTLLGGHYTSYARILGDGGVSPPLNAKPLGWRSFDDSLVSDIRDEKCLISSASYVLFYKLKE